MRPARPGAPSPEISTVPPFLWSEISPPEATKKRTRRGNRGVRGPKGRLPERGPEAAPPLLGPAPRPASCRLHSSPGSPPSARRDHRRARHRCPRSRSSSAGPSPSGRAAEHRTGSGCPTPGLALGLMRLLDGRRALFQFHLVKSAILSAFMASCRGSDAAISRELVTTMPGRQVGDPNGGIGRVHMLPARHRSTGRVSIRISEGFTSISILSSTTGIDPDGRKTTCAGVRRCHRG